MSHENALGDRIYAALKDAVLAGALDRHLRIDFAQLADEYGVSTTPVREAIMRLLGEGLVELHPKGGTRPARLSEYRLRALLDAQARLVRSALHGASRPILSGREWPALTTNESRARHIFGAIARSTENPEYVEIVERISDRLSPFRRYEESVLNHVSQELDGLHTALADLQALRRALRAYHRRRVAVVGKIIWKAGSAE